MSSEEEAFLHMPVGCRYRLLSSAGLLLPLAGILHSFLYAHGTGQPSLENAWAFREILDLGMIWVDRMSEVPPRS